MGPLSRPRLRTPRAVVTGVITAALLALTAGAVAWVRPWADARGPENDGAQETIDGHVEVGGADMQFLSVHDEFPPEGKASFEVGAHGVTNSKKRAPLFRGGYTVTIDARGLKSVADVELPCDAAGLVAVCTGTDIYAGRPPGQSWGVRIAAGGATENGDRGELSVTVEARDGRLPTVPGENDGKITRSVSVVVGAHVDSVAPPFGKVRAGTTFTAPMRLLNRGTAAADKVTLWYSYASGTSVAEEYRNCSYAAKPENDESVGQYFVKCTFEGNFAPRTPYRLSPPLKVRLADWALRESFVWRFEEPGKMDGSHYFPEDDAFRPGHGEKLTLEPVSDEDTRTKEHLAGWVEWTLAKDNPVDLDLTGDEVRGEKGETVTADITLRNRGPAKLPEMTTLLDFRFEAPEGTTVVDAPEGCDRYEDAKRREVYLCSADGPLQADRALHFPFSLRIDEVVEGAKGRAYYPHWDDEGNGKTDDPGWVVVNG